jgi:hypothetical protein
MIRRRRALLFSLLWVVIGAGIVFAVTLYSDVRREISTSSASKAEQIEEMERLLSAGRVREGEIPILEQRLHSRSTRLYRPGEMDVFSFGLAVCEVLGAAGVEVKRYVTVDSGRPTLEFAVSGSPQSIIQVLEVYDRWPKCVWLPFVSLHAFSGRVEGTFRISYETIE